MAATIGLWEVSTRLTVSCPSKLRRSAASWLVRAVNSSISAPAMKLSGFPEMRTTPRVLESSRRRISRASISTLTAAVSLLTGSPGKSKVMTAMPFSFWVVKALIAGSWELGAGGSLLHRSEFERIPIPASPVAPSTYLLTPSSDPLQHHRIPHPALGADRDEPELHIAPPHLSGKGGAQPGTGCAEGMPDRNGAAGHVGSPPVHLTHGAGQSQPIGPGLGAPGLHVGEHLGGKGFVNLDQPEILPAEAGPLQRFGHGVHRAHEQLPTGIHRRNRIATDVRQRLVPQRSGSVLTHQENGRGSVGQRR